MTTGAQTDIIDFLQDPASYPLPPDQVSRIDTHAAMVFLAGEDAYKIKRAVKYAYLDFSTLEKRRRACEAEIAVNRGNAPSIYLGTVAITRESDGRLALAGSGEVVEWAVHMRRFDETRTLDRLAERGELDEAILEELARRVADAHERAEPRPGADQHAALAGIVEQEAAEFAANPDLFAAAQANRLVALSVAALAANADLLSLRGRQGYVRRCHGDLHLRNIVAIDGRPVLFDAIEFDEAIATIDILYDLAFLLMDLDERGLRASANLVLNSWLKALRDANQLDALAALPLFLASRAAIRARVTASLIRHASAQERETHVRSLERYFTAALGYLTPPAPCLVVIGGLSGTGKTTVARGLAPPIGAAPGAVHLRSDVERKALFGVAETDRLGEEAYTAQATERVYAALMAQAARALKAGHSVVMDAVFSKERERADAEAVARNAGLPFYGIWLEAGEDVLVGRVEARSGDASDADAAVVRRQLGYDIGTMNWARVSAAGSRADVLARARRRLEKQGLAATTETN